MIKNTVYLIAYYFMRPRRHAPTHVEGWNKDPKNLMYDEKVAVARKISKNDQSMAKIILDIGNKKVVRNSWNNDLSFDQLFDYFYQGYPQYTKDIMNQFDPDYLKKYSSKQEIENTPALASSTISSV
jgi:hypothetical protein